MNSKMGAQDDGGGGESFNQAKFSKAVVEGSACCKKVVAKSSTDECAVYDACTVNGCKRR